MAEDTEEIVHDSTEWTRAVNRGKLIHVNDIVFSIFVEMELVLRKNFESSKPSLHEVVEVIKMCFLLGQLYLQAGNRKILTFFFA